jgi:hypothetical protein
MKGEGEEGGQENECWAVKKIYSRGIYTIYFPLLSF